MIHDHYGYWSEVKQVQKGFSLGVVDSSWNVMEHGDAREGKRRENWRMEWVASTLHTTSDRCVSSITTADAHISAASSRLNRRPRRVKWTRPFRRKTKSGFCACAITFQLASTWGGHKQQFSRQVLQIFVYLNGTRSWYGNWECTIILWNPHKITKLLWQHC